MLAGANQTPVSFRPKRPEPSSLHIITVDRFHYSCSTNRALLLVVSAACLRRTGHVILASREVAVCGNGVAAPPQALIGEYRIVLTVGRIPNEKRQSCIGWT